VGEEAMKLRYLVVISSALVLLVAASVGGAQSLGEIARQIREQKAREGKQPVKEYTNDNLPTWESAKKPIPISTATARPTQPAPEPAIAAPPASAQGSSEEESAQVSPAAPEPQPPTDQSTSDKIKTKEYWQSRFAAARTQLAEARGEIPLLEDELSLLQIQKARELGPNVSRPDLDSRIAAKKAELENKRAALERAQQALENLRREFNESGAPAEWSQE